MSISRADDRSRLALPLTFSTIGHLAVVAALLFIRPAPPKQLPPMYRVNIVAAPPGPRAEGVVVPPAVTPPPPPPKAAPVPPRAQTLPKSMPMPTTVPTKTVPPATPTPTPKATPPKSVSPAAGGGPTGDRGTDVATVRTEGVDFPFPGYLENIVRQIAKNFGEHRNTNVRAEVQFLIKRDGTVSAISFVTRSGNYSFDLDAQGAVEAAAKNNGFGPLPNGFSDDVLPVIFSFDPTVVH
ncbi:MAG: TonB C-terminal domain-containing protein [Gemmatimonadota bacterium]|nr:TonB C-terminal domain-containing protein [Gemmatimonadota bacterium]